MKALLICPGERPAVSRLAEAWPLALAPLFGKSFIEYWLEYLVTQGIREVVIAASDRPDHVRAAVGDGARWGLKIEIVSENRELTVEEALAKYCSSLETAAPTIVALTEHLPGRPLLRLFDSYRNWFSALQAWRPRALSPDRIGRGKGPPGVWIGLRSRIAPSAQLKAPCWIGENVIVGAHAVIGPGTILENDVVVDTGARVEQSIVGPSTFVGELTSTRNSIARGKILVSWETGSQLVVPDAFLLSSLDRRRGPEPVPSWLGRLAALFILLATSPVALAAMLKSRLRDQPVFRQRWAVRSLNSVRCPLDNTFAYYELRGAAGWLRRWPQLWNVVRGDFTWIGNRPLSRSEATALKSDFERLWLTAPIGLISLADAEYCREGVHAESCAHSSFYAVQAAIRLRCSIFSRAVFRAASSKILWQDRDKNVSVTFRMLKPQG